MALVLVGRFVLRRLIAARNAPPMRWKLLATRSQVMAEAIRIRQSMAKMLRRGQGVASSSLLQDVDILLEGLTRAIEIRDEARRLPNAEHSAAEATKQVNEALAQLEKAHLCLLDSAKAELDSAVAEVTRELSEHAERLRESVTAQREVEAMLEKKNDKPDKITKSN
ncbi:MAG TPA: hypothetical protein DCQ06_05975 [Myxococcales bacterium]|nr:hypothetical protein [Myxococcales bacterium]HAN31129.1 hypothetical protein [Myxococcales bacterium]